MSSERAKNHRLARRTILVRCRSEGGETLVGVEPEPHHDTRGDDWLALEEIRRLFDRYRQVTRHGMVSEHDEAGEFEEAEEPPTLTVR
jgi:hypothetical protein